MIIIFYVKNLDLLINDDALILGFGVSTSCCLFLLCLVSDRSNWNLTSCHCFFSLSVMLLRSCWSRATWRAVQSDWRASTCPSTTYWPGSASTTISLVQDAHMAFLSSAFCSSWRSWCGSDTVLFSCSKSKEKKKKKTHTCPAVHCSKLLSENKIPHGSRFFTHRQWCHGFIAIISVHES